MSITALWPFKSLKARLLVSAFLLIIFLLPIIGVTLNSAFEQQLQKAINNELSAYSHAILAVVEVENNMLLMPEQLTENRFNLFQSGLYAVITKNIAEVENNFLWASNSYFADELPSGLKTLALGENTFSESTIEEVPFLVYSIAVNFNAIEGEFPFTLHIILDKTDFVAVSTQFKHQLWMWLFILMVVLMAVQFAWLLWTLKPLSQMGKEVSAIEQGQKLTIEGKYPVELETVTEQLNTLLATEQHQRQRYRNALSDLAHSLKTPLAVIQSQQGLDESSQEQVATINQIIEYQLKKAQSAGDSSWHLGISLDEVVSKLVNSLNKIYFDKNVMIENQILDGLIFKGDETDLMEVLGNLIDNACKAAKSKVLLEAYTKNERLVIVISDDGIGISEEIKQQIFKRGTRADTYQSGHGIGLAIVRDIVDSYQGELAIEQSKTLGGASFILTFAQ